MSQTRFCTLLDNSHFLFLLKIINFLLLKNISYKIRGAWEEIRMENLPPQKQFLEILPVLTCISCREVKARLLCFTGDSHTHLTVALDSLALSPSHLVQTDTERGRKREKLSLLLDSPGSEVEDEWRSWIGS